MFRRRAGRATLTAALVIGLLSGCRAPLLPDSIIEQERAAELLDPPAPRRPCRNPADIAADIAAIERPIDRAAVTATRAATLDRRLDDLALQMQQASQPGACVQPDDVPWARLTRPWPDAKLAVRAIRAQKVTWPSTSPFTPDDIGALSDRAPPLNGTGYLYLPPGPHAPHSVPVVVFLHGSGGILPGREEVYGPQLASMGVAALVIGYFAARHDTHGEGSVEHVLNVTETMALTDAYGSLRFLAELPEIDVNRAVLAGFSYGAMATTFAMYATIADRLAPRGPRFAGHASFYGPCIARFVDPRTTGAPLLMMYGSADGIIDARRCAEIALDLRSGGSRVQTIVYPGAFHEWDAGIEPAQIGKILAGCSLVVDRDGAVYDHLTGMRMTGTLSRKLILGLCTLGADPFSAGANEMVRAASNRDFGRFLQAIFSQTEALHAAR